MRGLRSCALCRGEGRLSRKLGPAQPTRRRYWGPPVRRVQWLSPTELRGPSNAFGIPMADPPRRKRFARPGPKAAVERTRRRWNAPSRRVTRHESASISSIFAAARRCRVGTTWAYVLSVRLICECPRVSMIVRGSTPCASRSVAAGTVKLTTRWRADPRMDRCASSFSRHRSPHPRNGRSGLSRDGGELHGADGGRP